MEEINGRWYFVTPEGHAFFSLGATHAVECIRLDELNLFETRYGKSEETLAEFFLARFKEWGYNSSGYGPLPTMEKRIPYVATIWTEGPRSFSAGEKSRYTDIFDPAVQERLRQRVREAAAGHVDNPLLPRIRVHRSAGLASQAETRRKLLRFHPLARTPVRRAAKRMTTSWRSAERKARRPMTRRFSIGWPTPTTPASSANCASAIRITWFSATG